MTEVKCVEKRLPKREFNFRVFFVSEMFHIIDLEYFNQVRDYSGQ